MKQCMIVGRVKKDKNFHDAISIQYDYEMKTTKKLRRSSKKDTLETTLRKQKVKFNISGDIKIDRERIRSRYYRGNLTSKNIGPEYPMTDFESKLVELIIWKGRICKYLTRIQCLLLANDLIEGTAYEGKVIKFKEVRFKK